MPQRSTWLAVPLALLLASAVHAQTTTTPATPTPAKHKPNKYGSPLDTIMSTHLWTDVPPAQDFVRDTRPAPKDLKYTPLTGVDPDRPKPRDPANVLALQAELEAAGVHNAARGDGLRPATKARNARKHAAE